MLKLIVAVAYYYTPNWRWLNHQKLFQKTPAQARINALKQQQTMAKPALSAEREQQQQAKATEQAQPAQQAQQALTKARLP